VSMALQRQAKKWMPKMVHNFCDSSDPLYVRHTRVFLPFFAILFFSYPVLSFLSFPLLFSFCFFVGTHI